MEEGVYTDRCSEQRPRSEPGMIFLHCSCVLGLSEKLIVFPLAEDFQQTLNGY